MSTDVTVTLPKIAVTAGTVALTVARLREFVTTDRSDASLQLLIDDAFLAIDAEIGPQRAIRELFTVHGDLVLLSRRAQSITTVTENARLWPLVLAADDYELSPSGQTLIRLRTGTNPSWYWRGRIDVTYQPFDDTANRVRTAVELVKLELAYAPGLFAQSIGTWSETYQRNDPYEAQRASILASLHASPDGIV